jgi:hypothetical protein
MALAEFLKQIDLEELYEGLGSTAKSASDRQTQVHDSLKETVKNPDLESTSMEPVSPSQQFKHSSTKRTGTEISIPLPVDKTTGDGHVGGARDIKQGVPSAETTVQVIEEIAHRRERRLHSLIEEMWSLIPEEKKRGQSHFSRREKVEIATEHVRSLQEKIIDKQ